MRSRRSSGRGTLQSSRKRPAKLHVDNGDGFPGCRWLLCRGWICFADRPAWVGAQHRLGRQRWQVERMLIGARQAPAAVRHRAGRTRVP